MYSSCLVIAIVQSLLVTTVFNLFNWKVPNKLSWASPLKLGLFKLVLGHWISFRNLYHLRSHNVSSIAHAHIISGTYFSSLDQGIGQTDFSIEIMTRQTGIIKIKLTSTFDLISVRDTHSCGNYNFKHAFFLERIVCCYRYLQPIKATPIPRLQGTVVHGGYA